MLIKNTKFIFSAILCPLLFASGSCFAQKSVAAIPIINDVQSLKNVVTVSKQGGDFTDPVSAMRSITDASASNPYLVIIGPGTYSLGNRLTMKDYVSVMGSGVQTTRLSGRRGSYLATGSAAAVEMANYATLSNMTIINTGGGFDTSIGVYGSNLDGSAEILNVTVTAFGGSVGNYGIRNIGGQGLKITNVAATAFASGSASSWGIFNINASAIMNTVKATATGSSGTFTNVGIHNGGDSPIMERISAFASGGSTSHAVVNASAVTTIRYSHLEGLSSALNANVGSSTYISQSTITGGVNGRGAKFCVATDNGSGRLRSASCR